MAITINNAFVNNYSNLVRQLAQQGDSRLRNTVTEVSSKAEAYNFERLGSSEAALKVGRRVATVYTDDTWSRRVAVPKTYNHTLTIESEDRVQMLIDPQGPYAESQAMAMKRQFDRDIIAAATGTALDGAGAANAFPAGQGVGGAAQLMTLDLVTQVQELFMQNEIMPDEEKVMLVGPTQVRALMQLLQATSADYVQVQSLQRYGVVPNWLGFKWIVSNLLTAPAAGELYCLAYTKRAMGLAVNQDTFTRIGEDPAHSYMTQVFSQWTAGAVRVEDEHIVRVHVKDALV